MAQVISTNTLSLMTQNNLSKSQNQLNTAIERLSSGQRINGAKDDAAGLGIANRLSAQVTGLNMANRNANDGLSMAQTADSTLGQVQDNLRRVRELTVQANNQTLTPEDRDSIQSEVGQRLDEITRLTDQTQFNGIDLLKGGSISLQVGANDGQTISLSLQDTSLDKLGNLDEFKVNNADSTANLTGGAATGSISNYDALNLSASASAANEAGGKALVSFGTGANKTYAIRTTDVAAVTGANATPAKYSYQSVSFGKNYEGENVAVLGTSYTPTSSNDSGTVVNKNDEVTVRGGPATDALGVIDTALKTLDTARGNLGAQQNRLQSAIDGNAAMSTNLSAAKSQISDADYAKEVSNMTTANILQQAGTSVLAQANQRPQSVLSLLQ